MTKIKIFFKKLDDWSVRHSNGVSAFSSVLYFFCGFLAAFGFLGALLDMVCTDEQALMLAKYFVQTANNGLMPLL